MNIDEAIRKFKGYVLGENGFDELDLKEVIEDLVNKAREEQATMAVYAAEKGSETEKRLLKQLEIASKGGYRTKEVWYAPTLSKQIDDILHRTDIGNTIKRNAIMQLISDHSAKAVLSLSDDELEHLRAEINLELDKRAQDYMIEGLRDE